MNTTNKNILVTSIVVGLLLVAAGGLAIWSVSQNSQVADYNQNQTPTNTNTDNNTNPTDTNPLPAPEPGAPVVKTDSNAIPYISTVVVKGTVNPHGDMTTYWYEYGKTMALGTKTQNYLIGSGFVNTYTPAYIVGLQSNTDYYFRLSASNSFGTASGQIYSFKTNTVTPPQGSAPTISTSNATDIERTGATLHGKINPNGILSNFWFEYGTSLSLGSVTSFESTDSGNASLNVSAAALNLQPLTKYYFRINGQNQFGTVNGQILNFTTKGPGQASAPTVTTNSASAITSSSVKFNANVNPQGAQTTYWFEYSNSSMLSSNVLLSSPEQSLASNTSASNVFAMVDNLSSNTAYYYRVVAKNQYGTVRGQIKSVTTKK